MQTHGQFKLTRREALIARQPDHVMRWRDFRTWALDELQGKSTLIFRGHNSAEHSLVTSFHRTGRRNLLRYDTEDVPRLRRQMEVALNTTFNLLDPLEYV